MFERAPLWTRMFASGALTLALGACTVGPEHVRPEVELPAQFVEASDAHYADDAVASSVWGAFGEPELDALIKRALDANTTIAQALARLEENRAFAGLSTYSLFPTVTAEASGERSKPSGQDPNIPSDQGGITETYRAGFDVSWEIDLFGTLRRQNESIKRQVGADAAALDDVRLTIVAEVAQAWFSLRGTQARLAVQERNLANLKDNLKILREQLEAGRGTELDVARSNALGLSVAALIPATRAEITRHEQRLAVLTAQPVAALRTQMAPEKALPELPDLVPVGTPAEWLQRRPDIRAAEWRLAKEVSEIGVQVAEFFPKLNLLGSFGSTAQSFGNLAASGTSRWQFGPTLSWSFLDFGRVRQRVLAQRARADGAIGAYQEAWLKALEETENALANYRAANESAQALEQAVSESRKALDLGRMRFDAGASDFLVVLDAERSLLDFEDQHTQAVTRRATALAVLYKALAGDFVKAGNAVP
jgi:multidrug efflux system outer membrane protein